MSVAQIGKSTETCPRCHTSDEWGENSWCPQCGFYPAVDGEGGGGTSSWADALPEMVEEPEDNRTALQSIPAWFWIMLGGVVALAGFSIIIRVLYPDEDSPRGTIALLQLCTGLCSVLTAHILAARAAMKHDRRANLNDVLVSWFSIWQPTITALPATCKRVWAIVWGGIAVLTAVTIIGGIDYSAPFRTGKKPKDASVKIIGHVVKAATAAAGNKAVSMNEAMQELSNKVEETGQVNADGSIITRTMEEALDEMDSVQDQLTGTGEIIDGADSAEKERRRSLECFIYGVVTDDMDIPTSFLFAANITGRNQHVAEIKVKDLARDTFRVIAVRLYKEVQKEAEIETDRTAVWVSPEVICRLTFTGYKENGELKKAKFDAIVVKQRGRFDSPQSDLPHESK